MYIKAMKKKKYKIKIKKKKSCSSFQIQLKWQNLVSFFEFISKFNI